MEEDKHNHIQSVNDHKQESIKKSHESLHGMWMGNEERQLKMADSTLPPRMIGKGSFNRGRVSERQACTDF